MSVVDVEELQNWIGRTQTRHDVIAPAPAAGLWACLDHEQARDLTGELLPPCWHWLYFQDVVAASGLGADGHPGRGGFIPPVPLPRRMWAGSRLKFVSPLKVGDDARRESTIADVRHKQGRSGDLVFLTLHHQIFVGDVLAIDEEQDLVYRARDKSDGVVRPGTAPAAAQWSREITPDPVLLFRYSALTFNSHRIHYDREYATGEEGYASLVVQGPLTATLLLDLLHREIPGVQVAAFDFRAVRPLLEGSVLKLQGRRDDRDVLLWALDDSDALVMEAGVRLVSG